MQKTFFYARLNFQIDDTSGLKTKAQIISEFNIKDAAGNIIPESDLQEVVVNTGECATNANGILSKYNIIQHAESLLTYKDKRKKEYPDMADFLDAKVKQASATQAIKDEGAAQEAAYLAACLAVKAKYPKP